MGEVRPAGPAMVPAAVPRDGPLDLEQYRLELRRYCGRMLGSGFDAEDAVQETLLRAWRNLERFEGRSSLRTWLYRIATNVCLGMISGSERRAAPASVAIARAGRVDASNEALAELAGSVDEPRGDGDPASVAVGRESVRLAFVAALQSLSPRQRAVLILREVLNWRAAEVASLLGTSVASVNSALQRARAGLAARRASGALISAEVDAPERSLLADYVEAFEQYDIEGLVALLHDDAATGARKGASAASATTRGRARPLPRTRPAPCH